MLITLICEENLYSVFLPEKVRGKYWIEDPEKANDDPKRKILSIEEQEKKWCVRSGRKLQLYQLEDMQPATRIILEAGKMYAVEFDKKKKGYIFAEPFTEDRCRFQKYNVKNGAIINIGSGSDNQIQVKNPYVSAIHAQLSYVDGVWTILDNNSSNGIFVNEKRIYRTKKLELGDLIYILGIKIIVGPCFLAMNNPDNSVSLHTDLLTVYKPEAVLPYETPDEVIEKTYYRSPRFEKDITPLQLRIDAPSPQERDEQAPMILTVGPSLVMGTASFASATMTVINIVNNGGNVVTSIPSIVMAVSMLAGMVLFPYLMRRNERTRKLAREERRREKYLKYLENIRAEIRRASGVQQDILNENFPPVLFQIEESNFFDLTLWSRVIGRKNFLTVRLGVGNIPLQAKLTFPDQRFSIDDDVMRDKVNEFSEEIQMVTNVPVVYSMEKHRVSGIVGNSHAVGSVLHNILLQIDALHSYDEVKLVFLCEECDLEKYSYVKWMQHTWDNEFRMRYLASAPEEVRDLSAHFAHVIEKYRETPGVKCPHYLIVSTSKTLSDGCAFLADILNDSTLSGFSYLAVYDELKNLPKECTAIIQVNDSQGMLFDYQTGEQQINFVLDRVTRNDAVCASMNIAEYYLDLQGGKYVLPKMLTFLDMYQVGKYEHLNIANRWKENNAVLSLETPVGVNSDGGIFYLDLHENAHGPHGLIAGMTGSGKSEFIITFILSLAVNYSPDDVAFILIDYKGGGLVGAFDNEQYRLPHLSGTITNLDGSAITRSLLSIQSELRRRQVIFNEARKISNEGTMDIYKYQKLYRDGLVSAPLPHLFIIADEFAELKAQQPEFMTQLISTARIGRSLGVHLILATQKPSGVVNDQIWANSRFKICLKVQDKADSMDMLKRPDAAELIDTGRFYLQVGYNELFELGQSAWCGAPYQPRDVVETNVDEWVQMIDRQGKVVKETRPLKKQQNMGVARKQIVEIAQYISKIAEEEHLQARPLWLPEIPAVITVVQLEEKYQYKADSLLNPVIGEVDVPFDQQQKILTLPLSEKGNAICYGNAGSGKELFLTAILYSLYKNHSSRELHAYILDFGAETLKMFEQAPQTGGVVTAGEDERIKNLFRYLNHEIVRRKKILSESGENFENYHEKQPDEMPNIVILINNYTNFAEQYEQAEEGLLSLTRDCTKYGIYFIVTCVSLMGIRYKMQQNFPQIYVLQQNDKTDYVSILGNTGGVYPSKITGRGICRDRDVLEFQTAHVSEQTDKTAELIRTFCKNLKKDDAGYAVPIPVLPGTVHLKHLQQKEALFECVPIGMSIDTLDDICLNLKKESVIQILAMEYPDLRGFLEGVIGLFSRNSDCRLYVLDPDRMLRLSGIDAESYITEETGEAVRRLFADVVERHNAYKLNGTFESAEDSRPIVVFLVGLRKIKDKLDDDGRDKLKLILEKTRGEFQMSFWAADDYLASNSYSAETWCNGNGIWIGNGIEDQIRLKMPRRMESSGRMNFTDGYLVRQNICRQLKMLISDNMEAEKDDE